MDDGQKAIPALHKIKFVLGDWSGDGHGKYEEYMVLSSKSVEELRELHFAAVKLGIDPGEWASSYDEIDIPDEQIEALVKAGIDIGYVQYGIYREEVKGVPEYAVYYAEEVEGLLNLWLDVLKLLDETKSLTLEVVKDNVPTMHFYGLDEQGRHLDVPGYGMFN